MQIRHVVAYKTSHFARAFSYAPINGMPARGGGGGEAGHGVGFDCLCWPWGRALDWSCSPRGGDIWIFLRPTRRYLTADSDEKDWDHSRPQSPSFLGHVVGKRLQIKSSGSGDENGLRPNICFPLPRFTHAPYGLERWKLWRPTRTSGSWVDFTVLPPNFVCFSVFLINWTSSRGYCGIKVNGSKEQPSRFLQVQLISAVYGLFATITISL